MMGFSKDCLTGIAPLLQFSKVKGIREVCIEGGDPAIRVTIFCKLYTLSFVSQVPSGAGSRAFSPPLHFHPFTPPSVHCIDRP